MKHLHDVGYKKLFQNKIIFRELIETFVHEDWVRAVDFDACEMLDKSFIADHYKETESDLIYKLRMHGKRAYIVILLEFQSTVDRFMALRILNYMTAFYLDYAQSHRRVKQLPPVFPVVLYRGKRRWTAPVRISELIDNHDLLGRFAVQFEYWKIAEREFSPAELSRIGNIVSTVFLAETQYDPHLLAEECSHLFDCEDRQAFGLFLNWLMNLATHGRMPQEDYAQIVQTLRSKEEVKAMLLTTAKDYYDKVERQGEIKGKIEDARAMLAKGLRLDLIAEITGLPETVIGRVNTEDIARLLTEISSNQN